MKNQKIVYLIIILTLFLLLSGWLFGFLVLYSMKGGGGDILSQKQRSIIIYIADYPKQFLRAIKQITGKKFIINNQYSQLNDGYNHFQTKSLIPKGYFIKTSYDGKNADMYDFNNKLIKSWSLSNEDLKKFNLKKDTYINFIEFDKSTNSIIARSGIESGNVLFKIDKDSKVNWIYKSNTNYKGEFFHHDFSIDSDGNIYSPITKKNEKFSKYVNDFRDDGIIIIDKNGNKIFERYLSDIFINNNLQHLIFGVGPLEWDPFHLNDIEVAEEKSDFWKKGDLLLSLRHRSMILIYRPSTDKIIWYKIGPWLNQHDPDFLDQNRISIFGNDVTSLSFNRRETDAKLVYDNNKIYIYDFEKNKTISVYDNIINTNKEYTVTGGRHVWFDDNKLWLDFTNVGVISIMNEENVIGKIINKNKNNETIYGSFLYVKNY